MQKKASLVILFLFILPLFLSAKTTPANDWYWDAVVVLHNDNHCNLLARKHSADEIHNWIKDIPVSSVQVSAYGAMGHRVTYPSSAVAELNYPDLGDWDTLAVWKKAVQKTGKRFHIYMNTRGFKIHEKHPAWMQQNAKGEGKGRGTGLYDSCPRPSPDRDGYLEKILLPMISEISTRYKPDAFWVDGDHARTQTCYCKNCIASWRALTGKESPPVSPESRDWPLWLKLEQERYDAYRTAMAEEAHKNNSGIMYASNHSWHKILGDYAVKQDPRSAPEQMDYYTADLSHGTSLKQTRVYAMTLSAEEETPYDIMHSIYSPSITLPRVIQQGAVTLSSGAVWNLWVSGASITTKEARERAMFCANFAEIRKEALGRTFSINPVAVLISETSWLEERIGGKTGFYDYKAPKNAALSLQDSGYGVDIINEHMLLRGLSRYRVLVIANQRKLPESVVAEIKKFVGSGGTLIRSAETPLIPGDQSRVFTEDLHSVDYPDFDGVMAKYMKTAGFGPAIRIPGKGEKPHLICSFRRKGEKRVLHLTDITSFTGGKRVLPDKTECIDPDFIISKPLTVEIACPTKPASVTVAGGELLKYSWKSRIPWIAKTKKAFSVTLPPTTINHSWKDGVLKLNLDNFSVHAAVLIDKGGTFTEFLSLATPFKDRLANAHYSSLNVTESDFEAEAHGHLQNPLGIFNIADHFKKQVKVTNRVNAGGRSSLEFINTPKLSPYIYTRPHGFNRGRGVLSLDIRVEAGSCPWIDFRTAPSRKTHPVGPSVRIRGGKLIADGHGALHSLEIKRWHKLEISFPLDGCGTYSLMFITPDGKKHIYEELPCVNGTEFKSCGWVGVVSTGKADSKFQIDNFRLTLLKN